MIFNINKYAHIRFEDRGRGPWGFDCFGLVQSVFEDNGVLLGEYEISAYETALADAAFRAQKIKPSWVRVEDPKALDVVLMRNDDRHPDRLNHVGIMVGETMFAHIFKGSGLVCTKLTDKTWSRKIEGVYRYEG